MRESNNVSEEDGEQSERCLDVDQRRRRGARRTKSAQCEEEVERNGGEMAGSRTAALHFKHALQVILMKPGVMFTAGYICV